MTDKTLTAEEYNKYLIDNGIQINIIDYVKELNKLIYKIDILFIDNFLNLVDKDEICIPHKYLIEYGIITTENKSSHIIRLLNQFEPIENVDYQLTNVGQLRTQGGSGIKKEYTLHPRLFKFCLMRSKNTLIYSKYYILLEECIKYYNDYQLQMSKSEINRLINKLDIANENSKKLHEDNLITHNKLDISNKELKESNKKSDKLYNELVETNENLELIQDKLEERVPNAKEKDICEIFILLKHEDEKTYYILTRKENSIKKRIGELNVLGYNNILLRFKGCPNSRMLFNAMKNKISEYCKFIAAGNCREFTLLTTEQEYMDKLTEIYNSRKEYKE